MTNATASPPGGTGYDIIHFEALGAEAALLEEETAKAIQERQLPATHACLITPDTVQAFLAKNPGAVLPDLISTKTHSLLPESYLGGGRRSIVTRSAGYDHFEHLMHTANIASLREYCVNAVAQTAMKFVYATAGLLNHYETNCTTFERKHSSAFMELGSHRTLTVFGVGKIGKRIYDLAVANGLTAYGVDIRAGELDRQYGGTVRFVSREQAAAESDIMVNAMNLTKTPESPYRNVGYFSADYLAQAAKELIFINITRGEIAPEETLLRLYDAGRIIGIGLDVFSSEFEFARAMNNGSGEAGAFPAARELVKRAIERSANIYVQPHQAFNSDVAVQTKAVESIRHVIAWFRNKGTRFDDQLPYY